MKRKQLQEIKQWGISLPYVFLFKRKIHIGTLFILALVAYFIQHVTFGTVMKTELAKNGEITKGYIYESKGVGGKGTIYHYYTFKVANTLHENYAAYGKFSEKDSIFIVYDKQNPDKNWALKLLENDYPDQLQKNPNYRDLKNNEYLTRAKAH